MRINCTVLYCIILYCIVLTLRAGISRNVSKLLLVRSSNFSNTI